MSAAGFEAQSVGNCDFCLEELVEASVGSSAAVGKQIVACS